MTARSATLLAAALVCLAAPAHAQDDDDYDDEEVESADLAPLPGPATIDAGPEGWQGEWQGDWAEDGTYHGTWTGTYIEPGPTAARAIYPGGAAGTGYAAVERVAWLNQCRNAYYPGGMTGAVVASGQLDVCEGYLQQYERSIAMAAQGGAYAPGAYAQGAYAPGTYAPGVYPPAVYAPGGYPPGAAGYGYPSGPVMWVRVPIIREPVPTGQ